MVDGGEDVARPDGGAQAREVPGMHAVHDERVRRIGQQAVDAERDGTDAAQVEVCAKQKLSRSHNIDPTRAIFVRNLPDNSADIAQYLGSRVGETRRCIRTSPKTAIIEFQDSAFAAQANLFQPTGKYAQISIHAYQSKQREPTKHQPPHRQLGSLPRYKPGRGGMDQLPTGVPSIPAAVPNVSTDTIRRDWTLTANGQYVFRTLSLDRALLSSNLQCLDNPGGGDCGWHSVIDAGNLSSRFPRVTILRRFVCDYARAHPQELEQLAAYLQIDPAQRADWKRRLLASILTSGVDIDFEQLHITSQALNAVIIVTDIQTHSDHRIQPVNSGVSHLEIIRIAHRRHNAIQAYDDNFQPIGTLHGHYWAIVPLRRHSPRRAPRRLQLSDFVSLPNRRSGGSRRSNGANQEEDQPSQPGPDNSGPAPPSAPENDADPMIPDNLDPPSVPEEDLSLVDQQLALNILDQIELPPICVNWSTGFQFLVLHFRPDELFRHRIRTFRYIHGEARPGFRQCYIGVLTILDALPEYHQSPTAAFLHRRVLSLLTALPALLVSHVPGLGSNAVLDTIKKNCQWFLEAKWSHLYYAACKLNAQPPPLTPIATLSLLRYHPMKDLSVWFTNW